MRKVMYSTILLFVAIMVVVMAVSRWYPVKTVDYQNGTIVEKST